MRRETKKERALREEIERLTDDELQQLMKEPSLNPTLIGNGIERWQVTSAAQFEFHRRERERIRAEAIAARPRFAAMSDAELLAFSAGTFAGMTKGTLVAAEKEMRQRHEKWLDPMQRVRMASAMVNETKMLNDAPPG